jgi:hypothetical protein
MSTYTKLRVAAALATLAVLATPAAAQSYHYAGTYGRVESGTYPYGCSPEGNYTNTSFAKTCVGPTATGTIAASVDAQNQLHASSEVWGHVGFADSYRATAEAFFFDRIEFGANAPSELVFEVSLHGSVRGDGQATFGSLLGYGWGSEPVFGIGLGESNGWEVRTGTFVVPVVNGVAVFGLKLLTNAWIKPSIDGPCDGPDCTHAKADFSHTAFVSQIVGRDADGDVVNGLTARTQSGVAYALQGGTITSTPEPATVALMATGLVALVGVTRARRRTAA